MASFEKLKTYLAQCQQGIEEDAQKGILRFSSNQIEEGGRILFESIQRGGFATFIVPGKAGWDPEAQYYEAIRKQALKGKNITRLFLLPHRHYLRESRLRKHWELDKAAGINVKFAIISGLLPFNGVSMLPESLDFGIWDDEIVCWVYKQTENSQSSLGNWVATNRRDHVDIAQRIRDSLLAQEMSNTLTTSLEEFALDEPLTQSAPAMAVLSDFMCKGDHLNREDCSWYHRSWQYLRLLDLVSTPTWHSEFYLHAIRDHAKKDQKSKVLISGTADYSMLAYVLHAFNRAKSKPEVTVLDLCETPLMISKWYATKTKTDIHTVKEDIFKYSPKDKFDFIITDAFLTRFSRSEQHKILQKWADVLKKTGRIVTTIRLDPSADLVKPVRPSNKEIEDFVNRAERLAELWREFVLLEPSQIGLLAREYAEKIESYAIRDRQGLERLFAKAGLVFDMEEAIVKGEMVGTVYAEIIARKK
ncbi:MAG: class I SAM-dependent methyltransferase [Candidatus Kuenenia stuttgartiensis]|nr:class I SAM-dependent methyltransferase [Candidatus Kuenenia stuttgartiensis]